ncbi:MAG: ABC transporter ATP-binding protein [Planctomycetota bacterium]
MTSIQLQNVVKKYGKTTAVAGVDITINDGDLFFLLGPSGCGKTTILRMIAGFIMPTSGTIHFDKDDVTTLPPNKRETGMVFQSYALWPHMSVADNVAYGLDVRKVSGDERTTRVREALEAVQMDPYAARKPNELSGGQQQRVALARALVIKPRVLLLDEPLSNLDAKLRLEMRLEIKRICKSTGITTVYVTHDQKEALSMADQVAVLREGKVMQIGPPRSLYERPESRFVADFLGESNFISGTVATADNGIATIDTAAGALQSTATKASAGTKVTCSIRPEALQVIDSPATKNAMTVRRVDTVYLGEIAQHLVALPDETTVKVLELNPSHFGEPGDTLHLTIDPDDVVVIPDGAAV